MKWSDVRKERKQSNSDGYFSSSLCLFIVWVVVPCAPLLIDSSFEVTEQRRDTSIRNKGNRDAERSQISEREREWDGMEEEEKWVRREKDKKEQWREKQTQRREERVRGSNARERRGWTETRETTKRAAELNCLCGSRHFVFIYFTHNFIVGLRFFFF